MINFESLLFELMIVSTLVGLVTEVVKNRLIKANIEYKANTIAGMVSLILSSAVGIGNILLSGSGFTLVIIINIIVLMFASWLGAMIGYDKVVQTINQFKTYKKE